MLNKLNVQLPRCLLCRFRPCEGEGVARIVERHNSVEARQYRLQNLQTFRNEIIRMDVDARKASPRLRVALDQTINNRITPDSEYDRDPSCRALHRKRDGRSLCVDEVDFLSLQTPCRFLRGLPVTS